MRSIEAEEGRLVERTSMQVLHNKERHKELGCDDKCISLKHTRKKTCSWLVRHSVGSKPFGLVWAQSCNLDLVVSG